MSERRPVATFLLASLFLIAMEIAAVHPISHLGECAHADGTHHKHAAHHRDLCQLCMTLAPLAGSLPSLALAIQPPRRVTAVVEVVPALQTVTRLVYPPYFSRAPPIFG